MSQNRWMQLWISKTLQLNDGVLHCFCVTLWFHAIPHTLLLPLGVELNIWLRAIVLSAGYASKSSLSCTGSLWEGECPLLWQGGWRPDRLPHPSSIWASNCSVPDRIAPSYRVPLKCGVHGEQWAVPPHSSTRQPSSDQCHRGAGGVPGHLGPSVQCRWWAGLPLLQNPADCGGGQNKGATGRGGEDGERDMDAGGSWARGLLVWSRTLPRASSVGLIEKKKPNELQSLIHRRGMLWPTVTGSFEPTAWGWNLCSHSTMFHFWHCLPHVKTNTEQPGGCHLSRWQHF